MLFRIILLFVALSSCIVAPDAFARLSGANASHANSAFQFIERKDWNNALAHAKQVGDPAFLKLITWQYVLDSDSGTSFEEAARFIEANPNWPDQKRLHIRAEMALRNSAVADDDVIAWFNTPWYGKDDPITGIGKIALAEAFIHHKMEKPEKINQLIRSAWRDGDFDEPQENQILSTYGTALKNDDHIARISRLLWEEKITAAKRILDHVPSSYQKLFKARIALIADKKLSGVALLQVPSSLKNDPGLIYDRMRYRARRGDDKGVREMLLLAPDEPPYPEKWWRIREMQIREAIDEKNYAQAKKLLDNHGQVDGTAVADAIWLHGWLKTEFLRQPKDGYDDFYSMYNKVRYPVSRARAAFWAARSAEKGGDKEAAKSWYTTAASYPTTFYGQLASLQVNGSAPLRIPATPAISSEARRRFENNELVHAIKLCIELNEFKLASRMISLMIDNNDNDAEIALLAELGTQAGQKHLSVHAAKKALQQNVVLIDAGYPTPKTPSEQAIERPLTLAIARQESEFDPHARSPANALGMMQLLPRTAKEIAKKNKISFSAARLEEPAYNMQLGSLYLARLINSYDGSYIMGIAAYNAGPGNVRKWVRQFGTPDNRYDNALNWIEKIPFAETRNYVQRVLENLQVYRHIEADAGSARLMLDQDLLK